MFNEAEKKLDILSGEFTELPESLVIELVVSRITLVRCHKSDEVH